MEQRMGMPPGAYQDLTSALPDVAFVDAADVIVRLRMVKSKEEIEYIHQRGRRDGKSPPEAVRDDSTRA